MTRSGAAVVLAAAASALPAGLSLACGGGGDAARPPGPGAIGLAEAGGAVDAPLVDAGHADATLADGASDGANAGDAFPLCATMDFADCGVFTDLTDAASDARTISFSNYQYVPRCARIKAGQSVAFQGDFVTHPLVEACGPADILERRLPLDASPGIDATASFTLSPSGLYGYYCLDHGNKQGAAMSGAINVVP